MNDFLDLVPPLEAISLVSGIARKKKKRNLLGQATETIVESSLISTTANLI